MTKREIARAKSAEVKRRKEMAKLIGYTFLFGCQGEPVIGSESSTPEGYRVRVIECWATKDEGYFAGKVLCIGLVS